MAALLLAALLSVLIAPSFAAVELQQALLCNCNPTTPTDPVCDAGTLLPVGRTGCEAHCSGYRDFVKCSALRTLSFGEDNRECSCRTFFDPVCTDGSYVAMNEECAKCAGEKGAKKCKAEPWTEPPTVDLSCRCESDNTGDREPVCSTISGEELASTACEAECMGYTSFVPCSRMANRDALHPKTKKADVPLPFRNCTAIGPKMGDIAAVIGCKELARVCPRGRLAGNYLENTSAGRQFTVLPVCYSGATRVCYEVATEEALKDNICASLLTKRTRNCTPRQAREFFGRVVSRVCAEELRDGAVPLPLFGGDQ